MKIKNLNIFLVFLLLFAMHSVNAQSVREKFESDMKQNRKYQEAVLLKVKEQQTQLQAEKRTGSNVNTSQQTGANNSVQINTQTNNTQQKTNEIKPPIRPNSKKPVKEQQTIINNAVKKEEVNQ